MIYIYALIDPVTDRIRYIGKTDNPKRRFREHCKDKSRVHRSAWIKGLTSKGLEPIMEILETLPDDADWQYAERGWISFTKRIGCDLTNKTDGGEGVVNMSPESREKMRSTWIGRKHKPESIEKMISTKKGMYDQIFTQEYREKMSKAMKGRVFSDATKQKMSESAKKNFQNPEARAKIASYRRKLTDDQVFEILDLLQTRVKQTEIAKQFNVSPDTIAGIKYGRYYAHVGVLVKRVYDPYENKRVLIYPKQEMFIPDWLRSSK